MANESDGRRDRSFLPRAGVDLLVNAASLLVFLLLAVTGLLVMGEGRGRAGAGPWGFSVGQWTELHERLGVVLVALVVLHVVRHSRWVASVAAGKLLGDASGRRRTWAALTLTVVAFSAIAAGTLLSEGSGAHRRDAARRESPRHAFGTER